MHLTDPFAPWTPPPSRDELIAQARERGARVSFKAMPGGTGYYGEAGATITDAVATEAAAWDRLLERMALIQPGQRLLTSCEFAEVSFPNCQGPGEWLVTAIHRPRLEIRQIGHSFQVFSLTRLYIPGTEPRDVRQHREGEFATLGEAAAFVEQFLISYRDAGADERAAAQEHARATEY